MGKVSDLFKLSVKPLYGKVGLMPIDWSDPSSKISRYFTVKEACWLPTWQKMYSPDTTEQANILKIAQTMDLIRDFIKHPITISCWIRPKAYNADPRIGGAPSSMHIPGRAVDWTTGGSCDMLRKLLLPQLSFWKIRMEDKPGSNWIHIDNKDVDDKYRFFKP